MSFDRCVGYHEIACVVTCWSSVSQVMVQQLTPAETKRLETNNMLAVAAVAALVFGLMFGVFLLILR
jgi:ABC-type methionine transport system permease subunit